MPKPDHSKTEDVQQLIEQLNELKLQKAYKGLTEQIEDVIAKTESDCNDFTNIVQFIEGLVIGNKLYVEKYHHAPISF